MSRDCTAKLDKFGQITLNAGTYPIEMVYMGVWGRSCGAVCAERQSHELEQRF
jgi:hypothetical protein